MMRSISPRSGKARRLGGRPIRVGVIVDWLEDSYQNSVLAGVAEVAEQRNVSLVVFPGGVVGAAHGHGKSRNHIYRLIGASEFDALVILTGTLGNARGGDVRDAVCPDFPPERICSVAIPLPGSASVLIDNEKGMREAVEHLVTAHKYRRIAFIRGPITNAEAETRYRAYCDVLEAHEIPLEEQLVVQGDFRREAGVLAVKTLLDERKIPVQELDAIVAADDSMALAALEELKLRKLRVPVDIAVVGFDDVEEARYSNPPLSSVNQPLVEQGREAMRIALSLLTDQPLLEDKTLTTSFSRRRSCGCVPEGAIGNSDPAAAPQMNLSLEASLIKRRELILAEVTRASQGGFAALGRGWEVRLFNALQDEFRGQKESFRAGYDQLLEGVLAGGGDVSAGNSVISALRRQLTLGASDPASLRQIESLMHEARILTSDIVARAEAQLRIDTKRSARLLSGACAELLSSFSFKDLAAALESEMPRVRVQGCAVVRYCASDPKSAELMASWFDGVTRAADEVPRLFPAQELLPDDCLPQDQLVRLVVEPLLDKEEPLGFAVLQLSPVEGHVYELLQKVLGAALRASILSQTVNPSP